MSALTAAGFEQFLIRLDGDQRIAAEKYELLRRKLVKCLMWKGCPESEAATLADTALDRVAAKIAQGEEVKSMNAYACEVLRFVWLEHLRKRREIITESGEMPETAVEPNIEILQDPDVRLRCLRKCLAETISTDADRRLIIGYYDTEAGEKAKDVRKSLAERLGLTLPTLKVKACRLRERLEKCINECVGRLSVTKPLETDTAKQGGDAR